MAIDFDKVETVFEHNITEEEIRSIFYFTTTRNEFVSFSEIGRASCRERV